MAELSNSLIGHTVNPPKSEPDYNSVVETFYRLDVSTLMRMCDFLKQCLQTLRRNPQMGLCEVFHYQNQEMGTHFSILDFHTILAYEPKRISFGGYWFPINNNGWVIRDMILTESIEVFKNRIRFRTKMKEDQEVIGNYGIVGRM